MSPKPHKDPYLGSWNLLTLPGEKLEIRLEAGKYVAVLAGTTYASLEIDRYFNLRGAGICLCLHGRNARLFGITSPPPGHPDRYRMVAAVRTEWTGMDQPACGDDDEALFAPLVGRAFTVRSMAATFDGPVVLGEQVKITKGDGSYPIGRQAATFLPFDELCPHRANGTLNSRDFGEGKALRNVTFWDDGAATAKIFSLVAVGGSAFAAIRKGAADAADHDALAARYGLLPSELAALAGAPDDGQVGDRLLIWGADDGGG